MNKGTGIRRGSTAAIATLGAGIVALAFAPATFGIGIANTSTAAPSATPGLADVNQAGANANFTIDIDFTSPGDQVKDLVVGLPPGQIGDPNATPMCTTAELNSGAGCPASTRVGDVSVNALVGGVLPANPTGGLFNLVPQPGEPARFGIRLDALPLGPPFNQLLPPTILESGVELRTTDFGLNTVVKMIPNKTVLPVIGETDIDITSQTITLFGTAPGTGKPFSRNPTSCSPAITNFSATSYSGPTTTTPGTGTAQYTPTNCAAVPFSPEFSARIGAPGFTAPSTKPPITTSIKQTADEAGIQDTIVFLPSVIGADPALFTSACDISVFNAGSCPDISIIGSALASTPLLRVPLEGPVAIVSEPGNPIPKLGLDLRGSLPLKLTGSFVLTGGTGVQFSGLPDIPISNFELKFRENTLSTNSVNICKPPTPTFSTSFTAYSGATQSGITPAVIEGCLPPRPPGVKVKVKGKGRKAKLKLSVTAGSSKLREVVLKLPKSLRFGDAQAFDKGAKVKATGGNAFVTNGSRKLKLTLPAGADKVVAKIGNGALIRKGKAKPRFRVQVLDVDADRTSLTVPKKGKKKKKKKKK